MAITVQGLLGTGLQVRHAGVTTGIDADGRYASVTPAGEAPAVEVTAQPVAPSQRCDVSAATAESATITCGWPEAAFAYVGNTGSGTLDILSVDPVSGALAAAGAPSPFTENFPGVPDPSGAHFYVGRAAGAGAVSVHQVSPTDGTLSAPDTITVGLSPLRLAMDPRGRFVVAIYTVGGQLRPMRIDPDTGLAALSGPAVAGAGVGASGVFHPKGTWFYVTSSLGSTLRAFQVDPASGGLTPVGTPLALALQPDDIVADPSGRFLFCVNVNDSSVTTLRIDPATGLPAESGSITVAAGPLLLAVRPQGDLLYTANADGTIAAFRIDPATGLLTAAGTPLATASFPDAMAVDPAGRFLLVAGDDDMVSTYAVSPAGTVTFSGAVPSGGTSAGTLSLVPRR